MTSASTDVSEYDAIAKTVQHYIDGAKAGSGEVMRPAFHKDAMCFGYLGDDLIAGSIEQMFEGIEKMGPATGLQGGSIKYIGAVGSSPSGVERFPYLTGTALWHRWSFLLVLKA